MASAKKNDIEKKYKKGQSREEEQVFIASAKGRNGPKSPNTRSREWRHSVSICAVKKETDVKKTGSSEGINVNPKT